MEITKEEMQAMINAAVERRLDERSSNKARISKLIDEYEKDFEGFNYIEKGRPPFVNDTYERMHASKMRSAVTEIIRAHFRVENINKIPEERDGEVRTLVEAVLRAAKPKEA